MINPTERVIRSLILDLFDERYKDLEERPTPYHVAISTIYAYLSGAVPDAKIETCYKAIYDLCDDCLNNQSVYPYPDGGPWTDEERDRYLTYLHNHDKEDDNE